VYLLIDENGNKWLDNKLPEDDGELVDLKDHGIIECFEIIISSEVKDIYTLDDVNMYVYDILDETSIDRDNGKMVKMYQEDIGEE
jgi:hypothetical protein